LRKKQLPTTGKKVELKARLLNNEPRVHDNFLVDADKVIGQRRPKGERFQLSGLKHILEQTFGIRNRTTSGIGETDAWRLQQRAEKLETLLYPDSKLIDCLVYPDYRTNKVICNFCSNQQICNDNESRKYNQQIEYEIFSQEDPLDLKDLDSIKKWLQEYNHPHDNTNPLHQENMIFSDKLNPFKPGFSIQKGSKFFITRLDEVKAPNALGSHNWNHLFYSEIIGRTLTIFEAIYLNSVIQTREFSVDNKYPTIKQTKYFFENYQLMNNRVSRRVIGSNLSLYLSSKNEELKNENSFLYGAIKQTERLFRAGLYNEKLEIFSRFDPKSNFKQHLIELWHELLTGIYSENLMELESNLFEPRMQAQIFFPNEYISKSAELIIPLHFQTLRLIPIQGLSEAWLMSNTSIPKTQYINNQNGKIFPHSWLRSDFSISKEVRKILLDTPRKYSPAIWPRDNTKNYSIGKNYTRLNIFLARDIYSAMSMNSLFRKYVNSPGDSKQKKIQYQFHVILSEIFFQLIERNNKNTLQEEDIESLLEFRSEIFHPKYKRFKPLDILLKMSEKRFNPNNENSSKKFIEYQTTTKDLKKSEKFFIRSPEYMDANSQNKENLEWIFAKESEIDVHGRIVNSHGNRWKLFSRKGREIRLQSNRIENFEHLLNWKPFKERAEELPTLEMHNMYISNGMEKILSPSNKYSTNVWIKIITILNQLGVFGCTFFITPSELEEVSDLVGELSFRKLVLDDLNMTFLYGNPNEAITDLSPNFLHVGVLTD
jgi:hypothetical protein